ncbi:hypothetical protein E2C01_004324 [Portunus trituberculatus]|uniref:Uncharacterized protein n=1 Tax=Portunus trituberculatus TaxID=210409 RepID=A0A5B7CW37_PORTR|nr:hypothetical protein [Portunus trituberculatus]
MILNENLPALVSPHTLVVQHSKTIREHSKSQDTQVHFPDGYMHTSRSVANLNSDALPQLCPGWECPVSGRNKLARP